MRVLKFGGTSVSNANLLLRVVNILEDNARHEQVAIVLSAPAKVTNYLVAMVKKTINGQDALPDILKAEQIFIELINGLTNIYPNFPFIKLKLFIKQEFLQIKRILRKVSLFKKCPNDINATLISWGEKISIAIMTKILEIRGHKVKVINPVKKLFAIGHYLESIVNINESAKRIKADKIPIEYIILMAGFMAGNKNGELVVLGRNSSDYSAAVLAVCLHANCCEIWTDVDGIYTCDPHQTPSAKLLSSISYRKAIELSYFGAKVIHPRTITTIAQFNIPCLVKNINNPLAPGTLISMDIKDNKLFMRNTSNNLNKLIFNKFRLGARKMLVF